MDAPMTHLWTEEYRPETFDDIVGNEESIREIQNEVESGNMNHMFFHGPPGVGKTTTAEVIANTLYGGNDNQHFKELNASDSRGIDTVRQQVKKFAGKKTLTGKHKLVFLDEGDSLTKDAMQALRRIMEQYQEKCRFIISGNEPGGVIDAIRSRCSEHRFDPVEDEAAKGRLQYILDQEGVEVGDDTINKIVSVYSGDMRKQIGKLQAAATSDGDFSIETGEDYLKLLKMISDENFVAATKVASEENIKQLYGWIMSSDKVPNQVKSTTSVTYAKYTWRMQRSPDMDIQMNALVAELIEELSDYV